MLLLTFGIRVSEHGTDGQQHLARRQGGRPVVLENVEADRTTAVDVAERTAKTKRTQKKITSKRKSGQNCAAEQPRKGEVRNAVRVGSVQV